MPKAGIGSHLLTAFLIFMAITAAYTLIVGNTKTTKEVPLSEVATSINNGEVTKSLLTVTSLPLRLLTVQKRNQKRIGIIAH